ncbi:MAG: T9SS type A sorting domain-containing protein [Bacteroidales bacterium]|nr:T9SS type A sorting domain-containing protein [Bacteroidales bacterium]
MEKKFRHNRPHSMVIVLMLFASLFPLLSRASHFTTVWSGNPFDPMTIIVTGAVFDGTNLIAGDEIGLFDGAYCVGMGTIAAAINPANSATYLYIICSKDDPGTTGIEGYTAGNPITYKLWKQSNSSECANVIATFPFSPIGVFTTFTVNETSIVALSCSTTLPGPHFTKIWSGNPLDPMTIVVTQAMVDGINLMTGDEIGIFDGNQCVGTVILTAPINPQNSGSFVFIVCSKDDPGTTNIDGYTSGNPILYKLWNQSTAQEVTANATFPYAPTGVFQQFTINETAIVSLSGNNVPANLQVTNVIVTSGQNNCYNATQIITVAGAGTFFNVQSGGAATFIAGQKISFLPGTVVNFGGQLLAQISTNENYCSNVSYLAVNLSGPEGKQHLDSIIPGKFILYPNPTSNFFTIEFNGDERNLVKCVTILNSYGDIILSKKILGNGKLQINLQEQIPGLYFIKILMNGQIRIAKISKI